MRQCLGVGRRLLVLLVVLACCRPPAAAQTQPGSPTGAPTPGQQTPPRATRPGEAATKGTATIRGYVVAADTGTPLRRVLVRAVGSNTQDNVTTMTDDQGRFEVTELVGGRYTVMASRAGFVSLQYGQRRPGERGTPVNLAAGGLLEKLTIALPRGSVIAGRVFDDRGEPLVGARVQALRARYGPQGRRMMPTGQGATTDDLGAYRIHSLEPGSYVVSATLADFNVMTAGARAQGEEQGFAPTFFPGTSSVADAQRVTVGMGQEVGGIAFGLNSTRLARVRGRVLMPAGGAASGTVLARPDDMSQMGMMRPAPVDGDGVFQFAGLPPGRYFLQLQAQMPDDLVAVIPITVAGIDLDGITLTPQRPGVLRGRIEFDGAAPADIKPNQVRVFLNSVDPSGYLMMGSGRSPETAADFTFTTQGAYGPALVRVGGVPGWFLKGVFVSGQDVTDEPITLSLGSDIRDVRVVLTKTMGTVAGTIRDDRGAALLDATAVVFPADDARWTFASRFIRVGRPDTSGRFEITGLPPSTEYRIIAVQGLEDSQAYDPDYLASLRDRADRLSLAPGDTKSMDLKLK